MDEHNQSQSHDSLSSTTAPSSRQREVAGLFLRLGFTAFGGPAAHIAMMREEVVRRRQWISDARFVDLMGIANLIPGPTSTELAIYLGYLRAGWPGLLIAGVCFIVPAMLLVLGFAWMYVALSHLAAARAGFFTAYSRSSSPSSRRRSGTSGVRCLKESWRSCWPCWCWRCTCGVNVLLLLFGGALLYAVSAGWGGSARASLLALSLPAGGSFARGGWRHGGASLQPVAVIPDLPQTRRRHLRQRLCVTRFPARRPGAAPALADRSAVAGRHLGGAVHSRPRFHHGHLYRLPAGRPAGALLARWASSSPPSSSSRWSIRWPRACANRRSPPCCWTA